ncbi:hypothetical protein [Mesobacterium pallidum]|uniref:hypothetical protein n=1 Tax=Mesobacterium pallidum TaxID=2872037 RepID=UPI001EE217C4|nr:hypothetical protein [Mesobacterium pallidum]
MVIREWHHDHRHHLAAIEGAHCRFGNHRLRSITRGILSPLWDNFRVIGDKGGAPFVTGGDMLSTRCFSGARVNFAENLLNTGADRDPQGPGAGFPG